MAKPRGMRAEALLLFIINLNNFTLSVVAMRKEGQPLAVYYFCSILCSVLF